MYGHLVRIANWVRVTPEGVLDATPPRDVPRDMLVNPDEDLPPLDAVVKTPVFDADGRLVERPGYHRDARLWLHLAPGFEVPAVPERPTEEDVRAARALLLDDLLVDFPFAADSDRAHAIAALVLPFVRRMVAGCTPLHLLEAPTPGTGKGLLADVIAIVALGRPCDPTTITPDEDEARKKITSILARAQPLILLDNVKDGLDSAQLASALTAETWSDRLLGQTRMVDFPNRATWLVTANNPHLSLEIARRCVRVRIAGVRGRRRGRLLFVVIGDEPVLRRLGVRVPPGADPVRAEVPVARRGERASEADQPRALGLVADDAAEHVALAGEPQEVGRREPCVAVERPPRRHELPPRLPLRVRLLVELLRVLEEAGDAGVSEDPADHLGPALERSERLRPCRPSRGDPALHEDEDRVDERRAVPPHPVAQRRVLEDDALPRAVALRVDAFGDGLGEFLTGIEGAL